MNHASGAVLVIGVYALIATGFFIWLLVKRGDRLQELQELAAALGGRIAGGWPNKYALVESQGTLARIRLRSRYKNVPSQLRFELMMAPRFRWTVRRAGILNLDPCLDRLRKLESPMPPPLLHYGIDIMVSDQTQASVFFAEPSNLAAIEEFFARGFTVLAADEDRMNAFKHNYQDADLDPVLVRHQLARMRQLASV